MEPKFQSSFIPKGPAASTASTVSYSSVPKKRPKSFMSFMASALFALSLFFAGGVLFYKYFLNYRIAQMREELENARASLEPETVRGLIRLNDRLVSSETLIKNHVMMSPIFSLFEAATPKTVRYTGFTVDETTNGLQLTMQGQAKSYGALAVAAEALNQSTEYIKNPNFYDLQLDDQGNVIFKVKANLVTTHLSYVDYINSLPIKPSATSTSSTATATSTATSTVPNQ